MRNFLILSLLLIIGCEAYEESKYERIIVAKMKWLESADPEKDFEIAIKNNDLRFKAIGGYSLSTPGVEIECVGIDNVTVIEGSTGLIEGKEHFKLVKLAGTYAEKYNKKMLSFHNKHFGFQCN